MENKNATGSEKEIDNPEKEDTQFNIETNVDIADAHVDKGDKIDEQEEKEDEIDDKKEEKMEALRKIQKAGEHAPTAKPHAIFGAGRTRSRKTTQSKTKTRTKTKMKTTMLWTMTLRIKKSHGQ